jgi:hypothetical protein
MASDPKTIVSLRRLARVAPELDEDVIVTHESRIIGTFIPRRVIAAATELPVPRSAQDGESEPSSKTPVEVGGPGRTGASEQPGVPLARRAQAQRDEVLRRVRRGGKA